MAFAPRNRSLLNAYAAVALVNSCSTVETSATAMLLATKRQNGNAALSNRYGSSVAGLGSSPASTLSSCAAEVNEVATIHTNGPIIATAPNTRARYRRNLVIVHPPL